MGHKWTSKIAVNKEEKGEKTMVGKERPGEDERARQAGADEEN